MAKNVPTLFVMFMNALDAFDTTIQSIWDALGDEELRDIVMSDPKNVYAVLEGVAGFEDALRTKVQTFTRQLKQRRAFARQEHNSRLPIHRIPIETLADIFDFVVDDTSFHDHYPRVQSLASVSRHWEVIVKSSPSLWTRISPKYDAHLVQAALRFSGNMPLLVEYCSGRVGWDWYEPMDWFINLTRDHVSRWRSMEIHEVNYKQEEFLSGRAGTNLRYMSITSIDRPDLYHTKLFGGQTPNLEGVVLTSTEIQVYAGLFTNLKYLKLKRLRDWQCPLNDLIGILRTNPTLAYISLQEIETPEEYPTNPLPTIHLPNLITLEMLNVDTVLPYTLLPSLDAPALNQMYLWTNDDCFVDIAPEDMSSRILSAPLFKDRLPTSIIHSAVPTQDNWRTQCVAARYIDEKRGLNFWMSIRWSVNILLENINTTLEATYGKERALSIPRMIHLRHGRPLTVDEPHYPIFLSHLRKLSDLLPHTEALCQCCTSAEEMAALCDFLSRPLSSDSGPPVWPFSNLTMLGFRTDVKDGLPPIASMLQQRKRPRQYIAPPPEIKRLSIFAPNEYLMGAAPERSEVAVDHGVVHLEPHGWFASPKCWGSEDEERAWFVNSICGGH